jgi:hypothetical protein
LGISFPSINNSTQRNHWDIAPRVILLFPDFFSIPLSPNDPLRRFKSGNPARPKTPIYNGIGPPKVNFEITRFRMARLSPLCLAIVRPPLNSARKKFANGENPCYP